jgi:hypothetical protein
LQDGRVTTGLMPGALVRVARAVFGAVGLESGPIVTAGGVPGAASALVTSRMAVWTWRRVCGAVNSGIFCFARARFKV